MKYPALNGPKNTNRICWLTEGNKIVHTCILQTTRQVYHLVYNDSVPLIIHDNLRKSVFNS